MREEQYAVSLEHYLEKDYSQAFSITKLRDLDRKGCLERGYVNVYDYRHWIIQPCWLVTDNSGKERLVTPIEILYNIVTSRSAQQHERQIENSNTTEPIYIRRESPLDSRGSILDGYHRFAKAYKQGLTHIPVVWVSEEQLTRCRQRIR